MYITENSKIAKLTEIKNSWEKNTKMILVVGGTREGIEAAKILRNKSFSQDNPCDFKSIHGESILGGVVFLPRSLNCSMTANLIRKYKIKTLVDAAPVSSRGASLRAMSACQKTRTRYIRLEAPEVPFKEGQNIYLAENAGEACEKAMVIGETIFFNIGNYDMLAFARKAIQANKKIVIRTSELGTLKNFLKAGIKRHDILFIDGFFSEAFNRGLIKEYNISVFVTRDLGEGNGTDQELKATIAENIPIIIVKRPRLSYPEVTDDYNDLAQKIYRDAY